MSDAPKPIPIVERGENLIMYPEEKPGMVFLWPSRDADLTLGIGSVTCGSVPPDGAALLGVPIPDHPEVREIVGRFAEEMDWAAFARRYAERMNDVAYRVIFERMSEIRFDSPRRPIPEIEARAATSRYWAQRLRWLRRRGRA